MESKAIIIITVREMFCQEQKLRGGKDGNKRLLFGV